ncbi:hypothetical protein C8A00DRAFT_12981 [Chaetomidium leptoderma]|uniref:RING-type domain-containing protein n=1 Tax=Chaetomidium leptoderma TaxID=669021 RepID=A0AAN6VRG2_9PEZI|nr:hypothetical protein C8A00DRAFT_12981 [Chaetomidium leptoderma]
MTDSPRPALALAPAPNLETELTCSICTDLLYQPLTLLDCLHTFCAACLKEWFHFQAERIESAPGPPPAPGTAVFTCPSCRERVRDTRHDARVFSLLDMFLALNPGKGKSEEDKREMDGRYRKGDCILPRIPKMEGRTEEERRLDEEERRVVEEVRRVSLREATDRAAAAAGRRSREGSRRPQAGGGAAVRGDRRRSESRQRQQQQQQQQQDADARARQVEHQSSLRSLISADGMDSRDVEREIEDFARQIQEEGLLDGLDLDNLDLENNDELSRKITEAYRRRHRERRRDGGRRSNASAHSHRSDVSGRPRSRTDDTSRPTSRHTARAPSAGSNEERGRYPPSSSALLEVQEPSRRRRTSSGSRSATLPVVPTQADVRVGARSQTDLSLRSGTTDSHIRRPIMGVDARSSSSPTAARAPVSRGDSPANRGLPFSARAAAGLSIAQPQTKARASSTSSRQRSNRPPALDIRPESPTLGSSSAPISPALVSPPLLSPRRPQLPRYKEPLIHCNTCAKEHIEYDLHYNCHMCHNGEWNICLDCWHRRKGCLHWFGFGSGAWARWDSLNRTGQPIPPPHMLTANRYIPPKQIPGGAEGRRVLTTENPLDRLQSGTFCGGCSAWTNDCYWRCDVCNEGEWGFCNDCVNQGKTCTHPLLALAYRPPSSSSSPPVSPPISPPTTTTTPNTTNPAATATATSAIGNFHPLISTPPCSACRIPIPQTDPHHHCNDCSPPSSTTTTTTTLGGEEQQQGVGGYGYNLCFPCYDALVVEGSIAAENGPAGWRRCLKGHRMVVVDFVVVAAAAVAVAVDQEHRGSSSMRRRRVARDLVGGRRLRFEDYAGGDEDNGGAAAKLQVCSWQEEEEGGSRRRLERLFARDDVAVSTAGLLSRRPEGGRFTEAFPPDGGAGPRAVAEWGWVPGAGGEDELMFHRGAEIVEVEDVNGDWFHGYYMGGNGVFPAPYVRLVKR